VSVADAERSQDAVENRGDAHHAGIADVSVTTAGVTLKQVSRFAPRRGATCRHGPPRFVLHDQVRYRTATSSKSAASAFAATARPSASPASISKR
jgi:hypothetical protein